MHSFGRGIPTRLSISMAMAPALALVVFWCKRTASDLISDSVTANGHGFLKDHRDLPAAYLPDLFPVGF